MQQTVILRLQFLFSPKLRETLLNSLQLIQLAQPSSCTYPPSTHTQTYPMLVSRSHSPRAHRDPGSTQGPHSPACREHTFVLTPSIQKANKSVWDSFNCMAHTPCSQAIQTQGLEKQFILSRTNSLSPTADFPTTVPLREVSLYHLSDPESKARPLATDTCSSVAGLNWHAVSSVWLDNPMLCFPWLAYPAHAGSALPVTYVSCSRRRTMRCMCSHRCQKLASMERIGFQ